MKEKSMRFLSCCVCAAVCGAGWYYAPLIDDPEGVNLARLAALGLGAIFLFVAAVNLAVMVLWLAFAYAFKGPIFVVKIIYTIVMAILRGIGARPQGATGKNPLSDLIPSIPIYKRWFAWTLGTLVSVGGSAVLWKFGSHVPQESFAVPAALGGFIAFIPSMSEWLQTRKPVRRQIRAGGPPMETFMVSAELRGLVDSFKWTRGEGYTTEKRYLGETLFETTGKPLQLFSPADVCELVCARTGSGKTLTDIGIQGATFSGSAVIVSPKEELANLLLGRRSDPEWHQGLAGKRKRHPGVDASQHTTVKYHLNGGRTMLVDPDGWSKYQTVGYPFLHEIPLNKPAMATALIDQIAMALLPPNPRDNQPFFADATRGWIKAGIAHVVTTFPRHQHNLVTLTKFLAGINPETGQADPELLDRAIAAMMGNNKFGMYIPAEAQAVANLGTKQFGSIFREVMNALAWTLSPGVMEYMQQPPAFSYRELLESGTSPLTVFIVPPRANKTMRDTFMRLHSAVSMTLLKQQATKPKSPIWFCLDEAPMYMTAELLQMCLQLRSYRVNMSVYTQNLIALQNKVGKEAMELFMAEASERFFGIKDETTSGYLSRAFGNRMHESGRDFPILSPLDVLRELSPTNAVQYVRPYGYQMMRLARAGYTAVRTSAGLKVKGLPLKGHFDGHLI